MRSEEQQREQVAAFDEKFGHGSRSLVTSEDPVVRYLTRWRMETAWRHLAARCDLGSQPSVLFLCAGDAGEATTLADLGVQDITVTDNSPAAVRAALAADSRLTGFTCNALSNDLPSQSYDVVIVQDGLHHLPEPVRGFTEMLRIAAKAAFFLEGANSAAGRLFGRRWEQEGTHENFVFRWDFDLVEQVSCAYLGRGAFRNETFSFWHHNVHLDRLARRLGPSSRALGVVKALKTTADTVAPRGGNQICGMVIKENPQPSHGG